MNFKQSIQSNIRFNQLSELNLFLLLHFVFSLLCIITLTFFSFLSVGFRLFSLVLLYIIGIPLISWIREDIEWMNIWTFSFLVSIMQFIPDWFLSAELDILVFPEDGFLRIDTVSAYMLGLWVIPLFIILFLGIQIEGRYSKKYGAGFAGIVALVIFGLSEQFLTISWYAQNVTMVGNVAMYILMPEVILGLSTYWMFNQVKDMRINYYVVGAYLVMIMYLGNSALFYFLLEKVIL